MTCIYIPSVGTAAFHCTPHACNVGVNFGPLIYEVVTYGRKLHNCPDWLLEALRERISRLSEANFRITEDNPTYFSNVPRLGDQMEKGETKMQYVSGAPSGSTS